MSAHNRVVWSEGLFLQPQHFQQQDRYFERYVETRCQALVPHSWGFTEIEFERDFLKIGKIGLRRLAGVFPDGTPFRMPDDDPLPPPIDIGCGRARSAPLSWPCRCAGRASSKSARGPRTDELVRQDVREFQARQRRGKRRRSGDARSGGAAHASAARARGDAGLCLRSAGARGRVPRRSSRSCSTTPSSRPCCRCGPRTAWRPSRRSCSACSTSAARPWAVAWRRPARGAASELADFLMLQAINRYEPLAGALRRGAASSTPRRSSSSASPRPASSPRSRPPRSARRDSRRTGTIA